MKGRAFWAGVIVVLVGFTARFASLAGAADAREEAAAKAEQLFRGGLALEQEAESAGISPTSIQSFEKAIEHYRQAVQLKTDFFLAHVMWSHCLLNLAVRHTDAAQRRRDQQAAFDRFVIAKQCPGADWTLYLKWGEMLTGQALTATAETADRRLWLAEARKAYETGATMARFQTQRGQLFNGLGICLATDANFANAPAEKRQLYQDAVAAFQAANADGVTAAGHGAWGLSLLMLSKPDQDRKLIEQAVLQLSKAVALESRTVEFQYNLACAHAALGQPAEAVQHLRACLEADHSGRYASVAANDPDLQSLRGDAAFAQLIAHTPADGNVESLCAGGLALMREADARHDSAAARDLFEKALTKFREAEQVRPDFYPAQNMLAHCLAGFARNTPDAYQRRVLFQSANEKYASAARNPGADCHLYCEWGTMLTDDLDNIARDDTQRREVLKQSRRILETALSLATFNMDRARIASQLGVCLALLGSATSEPAHRKECFTEAIAQFGAATKLQPESHSVPHYAAWGLAAVQLSKLTGQRVLLREAIDQLQHGLDNAPASADLHYNMACAYALMGQTEPALRHLRDCFTFDADHVYQKTASNDADLQSLRNLPEFRELIGQTSPAPAKIFTQPEVKNK